MPLILWAAIVWIAATAAGLASADAMRAGVVVACAGALGGIVWVTSARGRLEPILALSLLAAAGLVLGDDVRTADARCVADLRVARAWDVVLMDAATPGSFSRGRSGVRGCRVSVAIAVRSGDARAGARVRVSRGEASDGPRGVLIRDAVLTETAPPSALARWRNHTAARLDRLFGPDAPMVKALLIADTRGLSPELRQRFADAGLVHILSISGLHVAIVGGALLLLFQSLRLPADLARGAAVGAIALYVLAIGAPAPAVRSATLFACTAITRVWQRPVSPWGGVALGSLVPLWDPRTVLDLGWQLSVAGYAAVVVAARAGRRVVPESWEGWRGALARELIAGALTTAATAPLVAWHFGRLSLVAPLTNLLAGPVVTLLQPTLFLAMLVPGDAIGGFVADAARPLLAALDASALLGASLPGASVPVAPTLLTATLSGVSVCAVLVAGWSRHWRRPLTLAVAVIGVLAWWPAGAVASSGEFEVHLLDVGQGDAVALRTPRGQWVLVDAGRAWAGGDAGRATIVPHLRRHGGPLAMLVLTHPHLDHIGGAASVLRALRPAQVRDAAFIEPSVPYRQLLLNAQEVGTRWQRVQPGEIVELDGVRFEFLAPDSAWTASLNDPNEASTVLRVSYGSVSVLLTGDAEEGEEAWLRAHAGAALASTVLKVGHHGSRTSSTEAFVDAVAPRLALVSVGAGNHYGHPSPDVMRRLAERGATVLRTDQLGTIRLSTNGHRLRVSAGGHEWDVHRPLPEMP